MGVDIRFFKEKFEKNPQTKEVKVTDRTMLASFNKAMYFVAFMLNHGFDEETYRPCVFTKEVASELLEKCEKVLSDRNPEQTLPLIICPKNIFFGWGGYDERYYMLVAQTKRFMERLLSEVFPKLKKRTERIMFTVSY